ncbi:MAG: hypothetical protein ACTSX8_09085 [Alphaproteobacteria bacterium]
MTDKLMKLAFRYGGLLIEAVVTYLRARQEKLTEAEIDAEVRRILDREREDFVADWDTVNS